MDEQTNGWINHLISIRLSVTQDFEGAPLNIPCLSDRHSAINDDSSHRNSRLSDESESDGAVRREECERFRCSWGCTCHVRVSHGR